MPKTVRRFEHARFFVLFSLLLLLSLHCVASAAVSAMPDQVVVGNARFTVINANLIRLEYQPSGQFVELPSIFATERGGTTPVQFSVISVGSATIVKTANILLTYLPDGRPFDSTNLSIVVNVDGSTSRWIPGTNDPANLGGTNRTLDGMRGPVDVGQGVLSRSGWSVVDDSLSPLLTQDGWVESRPDSQKAGQDWYFFGYGDNYRTALCSLTTISGAVPMPRRYALGVWYSRYWPWSEDDYKNIVTKYGTEDFPLDNVVLDMDWHEDGWTGWSWNTKLLPDAPGLLSWFHSQGLHDTVNLHPADGVAPHEDQYAPFMKALNLDPTSQQTVPFDAGSKPYMDALFSTVLDPLKNNGVDFWWLDWQQYPFTKSVPDLTNLFWLNTLLYNYTSEGGQRGLSFSRWAGWGDQRHPIHFSGDADTGFPMLAFEVPFTSTAGNVGCFFWSHDIGGHLGGRNEESYARWCQFGATSPVLRSHSTRDPLTDRAPWNYPKWAEDSMRVSFHLRSQLFPYIYTSAHESCSQSVPLDRPVYFDLPNIEEAYHNGQEFELGDNLLVAPITSAGAGPGHIAYQTVWFPPTASGYWYNILTGERATQSTNCLVASDIDEFPIYARGGVPIPMQPYTPRMGTTQIQTLRIRCYPGKDGQVGKSSLYEDDGVTTAYIQGASATTSFLFKRTAQYAKIIVYPVVGAYTGQPAERSYIFELPDIARPTKVFINGLPAKSYYDPPSFTLTVSTPALPITKAVILFLTGYHPKGWDNLQQICTARRVAGSVDNFSFTGNTNGILSAALAATTDPIEQTAALAAAGIGVVRKNISTTFYPEAYQNLAFVTNDLPSGTTVQFGDGTTGAEIPAGSSNIVVPANGNRPGRIVVTISGTTYFIPPKLPGIGSDDNVALDATATASSTSGGSTAMGAIDGVVGGYPSNQTQEWASNGEKAGAWLQLSWIAPQTIDRIWLFDRPNQNDQVTGGTITFSDGSSVAVGTLPNDATAPLEVTFPPKTITSLKFTVTSVSPTTENVGLSEIAVFKAGSHP